MKLSEKLKMVVDNVLVAENVWTVFSKCPEVLLLTGSAQSPSWNRDAGTGECLKSYGFLSADWDPVLN